jgi:tRNA (cmo5U34)-methyltransferase
MHHNDYIAAEHAMAYLAGADKIPHRTEGESVALSFIPSTSRRVLDLGTGDGRLLSLVLAHCAGATGLGVDSSATMLGAARDRFQENDRVAIQLHDLNDSLLGLGRFDVVVSSFAIHHCSDARKRSIYEEIFQLMEPGGVFLNLEHVSSATPSLHQRFLDELGITPEQEDAGNILLDTQSQIRWLREIGYVDVDCYWKWLELSLFGGFRAVAVGTGP